MRLRYTGSAPVSFMALGAEVFPGYEFDVPDTDADAYLSRDDVEAAAPAPSARARKPKAAAPTTSADPASVSAASPEEGDVDAVPDSDH